MLFRSVNGVITIDDEQIGYSSVDPALNLISGLIRGVNETTIVDHIPGALVYVDLPAVILLSGGKGYTEAPKVTAFIDTTVANYQTLVNDLRSGIDVYLLNNSLDPWQQMTGVIKDYQGVRAIHLISHGSEADVIIGEKGYGIQEINAEATKISQWSSHLTTDADILLYG